MTLRAHSIGQSATMPLQPVRLVFLAEARRCSKQQKQDCGSHDHFRFNIVGMLSPLETERSGIGRIELLAALRSLFEWKNSMRQQSWNDHGAQDAPGTAHR
jgi:hypothetical protein